MSDVEWTAREAMACAYCWSEFNAPEKTGVASPEAYWLSITERARNDCRRIANDMLLLAVARGQARAMMPPATWDTGKRVNLATAMNIRAPWRVSKAIHGVWNLLQRADPKAPTP